MCDTNSSLVLLPCLTPVVTSYNIVLASKRLIWKTPRKKKKISFLISGLCRTSSHSTGRRIGISRDLDYGHWRMECYRVIYRSGCVSFIHIISPTEFSTNLKKSPNSTIKSSRTQLERRTKTKLSHSQLLQYHLAEHLGKYFMLSVATLSFNPVLLIQRVTCNASLIGKQRSLRNPLSTWRRFHPWPWWANCICPDFRFIPK